MVEFIETPRFPATIAEAPAGGPAEAGDPLGEGIEARGSK